MFKFDNKDAGGIIRWVLLGVLGLVLIINRRFALNIVYVIFGIGLMLVGISSLVGWWQNRAYQQDDLFSLLGGIALFVIGLWVFRNPSSFDKIINVLIGLVMIVTGVNWLSVNAQGTRDRLMKILSIVAIVLGVMIAFSRAATGWIATAGGIALIYTAVTGLIGEKLFHS